MYNTKKFICLAIAGICMFACRPAGDDILSYGRNDYQSFDPASESYSQQFKALWLAMNENYCIWDYESEHGVDWDAVYETYLPQFEALDEEAKSAEITRERVETLYRQFLDSLHDGHLAIQLKFPANGSSIISISPGRDRNVRERNEEYELTKQYITTPAIYSIQGGNCHIEELDSVNGLSAAFTFAAGQLQQILACGQTFLDELEPMYGTSAAIDSTYRSVEKLVEQAEYIVTSYVAENNMWSTVVTYNALCDRYSGLDNIIGVSMTKVDDALYQDNLGSIYVARFAGNIMYLRLSTFVLTRHLEPSMRSTDTTSMYYAYQKQVESVWHKWFDAIRLYHSEGTLGGIIIDVRNNSGGYVNDYKYVIGALLPEGGYSPCMMRIKNGLGRLDYAPLMPFVMPTYSGEHAVITEEPVVVLANIQSGSMAEQTAWGAKTMPNGVFIGTRTWGGLSALNTDPADYSTSYSGAFGVQYETSIFGYVPKYVALYDVNNDGIYKVIEGIGITPDIEVPFDVDLYTSTGRDNQLEAAINYIDTH